MTRRIRHWRWRLARLIAPTPIMADPYPGQQSFIVVRSKPEERFAWSVAHSLDEVNITTDLEPLVGEDDLVYGIGKRRTRVTAAGPA